MAHESEFVRNCVAVQKPDDFDVLRAQAQLNVEPKHSEGSASVQLRWLRLTRNGIVLEQIGNAEPQPMGEDHPVYEHYTSLEPCGPRGVWQAWVSWAVTWSDGAQEGFTISTPHLSGLCA